VRYRPIPAGRAEGPRSGAVATAYVLSGVRYADLSFVDGQRTLEELREIRAMLDATIRRLETSPTPET
jgi:hypothetical protein